MFFPRKQDMNRQLIAIMVVLVAMYFICMLPYNAIVFLFVTFPEMLVDVDYDVFYCVLTAARILFFINSCANPVIYNVFSSNFRAAFRRVFTGDTSGMRLTSRDATIVVRINRSDDSDSANNAVSIRRISNTCSNHSLRVNLLR
ncbi:unnamed protein product [Soboliphyme baturini]|uniref:G_PROTEIN_RECEP_F1_2 domain-containing protein n=1 Tax=Soboliphyme baturini TaxID=241478 RepID=A0A183IY77_9BILA|nr:unnamed protein product [Soboliphyme baturini]